jgi:fumarate reductase flavoprotein subunit
MKIVYTDVLVIGGGLAGLRLAVAARRRGHDAIILSLVPPKRSHSKAAQGGMQASLGNVIKGEGDNEDVHFEDTVRGSDWGADQEVVRMFVNTAPKAVRELAAWGVPWSRVSKGDREVVINGKRVTITERDEAHGLLAQRDFGGTKKWRTCYVSDWHRPRDDHGRLRPRDRGIGRGARAQGSPRAHPRRRPLLRRRSSATW